MNSTGALSLFWDPQLSTNNPQPCSDQGAALDPLGLTPAQTRAKGQALWTPALATGAMLFSTVQQRSQTFEKFCSTSKDPDLTSPSVKAINDNSVAQSYY